MPASDSSRWWLAAEGVVGVAMFALPWSFGGAPSWTYQLLYFLGCLSFALWSIGAARNHRRWAWHAVVLVPIAVLALALAQQLPLPPGLYNFLTVPGGELRDFALLPLQLSRWRPLSMDAPSTARAIGRLVGLIGLMLTTLQLGRQAAVRRRLSMVIALSGVSVSLCGLIHLLAGEETYFGTYHFATAARLMTPFGNTNHLAAFLSLTGSVALALALDSRDKRDETIGWLMAAFVCGVGVFLSYSRGGIASFVATWCVIGAAVLARRGGGLRSVLPWVAIGTTIIFAALLSFEELVERADTISSVEKLRATKVELWPMLTTGALQYWPLGLGVGAFELGFSRFQTEELDVTFTHPENLVLQWVAEAGVPFTLLLFVCVGFIGWQLWKAIRETSFERYLFIAIAGVLVHDVFDFALELNAVSACVVVLVGLVASADRRGHSARLAVRGQGLFAVIALALVGGLALAFGLPTHLEAEQLLANSMKLRRPPQEVRALALAQIDRHPADWVLYANTASEFAAAGDPLESLAWVNRVLFLRPNDARVHLSAAQALLRLKKPMQALDEYTTAWRLGDASSLSKGLQIAAKLHAWDRVLLERPGHLTDLWNSLRRDAKNTEAVDLLDEAIAFAPNEQVAHEAAALRMRHEAELGDPAKALVLLDGLDATERSRVENQLVRIHLLARLGNSDASLKALEQLQTQAPADLTVAVELITALQTRGRPIAALEVVGRMKPFVAAPNQRSLLFQREADLWAAQERWGRAIEALQTSSRIEPTRPDLHYRLGELYERMGSLHSALDEVRKGRTLDSPEGAKTKDPWVARLEGAQLP